MTRVDNWDGVELPSGFVGRRREIRWLRDHVRQHGRLLVISGPGGVGRRVSSDSSWPMLLRVDRRFS